MCGIAGRIRADGGSVGADIVRLAACMRHRGPDSTGFGVYRPPRGRGYLARLFLDDRARLHQTLTGIEETTKSLGCDFLEDPSWDETGQPHVLIRLVLDELSDIASWVSACESHAGVQVQSVGRSLEVIKDVGDAEEVDGKHGVSAMTGTHALSNMRLATESLVSPTASHPFWARPFPDVCIVHNGQLTNYFTWRRRLERAGYTFASENDSELIAVWNSVRMAEGDSLGTSLRRSLRELDGVFTYLLGTPGGIGMAKDRWAIKPLAAIEAGADIALATEEQALRSLYVDETPIVNYDGPSLTTVWQLGREEASAA